MIKMIGLKFRKDPNIYYIKADDIPEISEKNLGQFYIFNKDDQQDIAEISFFGSKDTSQLNQIKFERAVHEKDFDDILLLDSLEQEAYDRCQQEIAIQKLQMKLVGVKMTFDQKKLTFYFTAEGRIDFRDLVKNLVSTFRKLIRLEQINQRDEAAIIGGIGPCGRRLCCESFLADRTAVSMECVRCQNLHNVKSSKVSGYCGKLMCCLGYEVKQYQEQNKGLPEVGEEFATKEGRGIVIDKKILERKVTVHVDKKYIEVQL